jgi:uncharacterized protein (DUF2236 family)
MFGPDSLAWRIGGESVLLLGGARALILQTAHPQVAAGVAQHSDYRRQPWTRLYRTLDLTLRIAFGDAESSRRAAESLRAVHARVRGSDDRGRPYDALDPELLLWVHATLVETSLTIYGRFVRPPGAREAAAYYQEVIRLGEAYGIPRERQPADYAAFRRYWGAMLASGLRVTEVTHDVVDAIANPPLPAFWRPAARPALEAIRLVTIGTLPEGLRHELGLGWGPGRERLLAASQLAIRRLMPVLPGVLRTFPHARATRRVG